jgi:hypothetical protein
MPPNGESSFDFVDRCPKCCRRGTDVYSAGNNMVVNAPPASFEATPEEVASFPGVERNVVAGRSYEVNEIDSRNTYEEALLAIRYTFQRIMKTGSVGGAGNTHYIGHTIYLTHENEKLFTEQLPVLPKHTNITVIYVNNRRAIGPSKLPFQLKCAGRT